MQILKTLLKKISECFISFSHPVNCCSRMIVLMPFYGQLQRFMIHFLQEISAHSESQFSFGESCWPVKNPVAEANSQKTSRIYPDVPHHISAIFLHIVYENPIDDWIQCLHHIAHHKPKIYPCETPFLAFGIIPSHAEHVYVRVVFQFFFCKIKELVLSKTKIQSLCINFLYLPFHFFLDNIKMVFLFVSH